MFNVTLPPATFIWNTSPSADWINAVEFVMLPLVTTRPVAAVLLRSVRPLPVCRMLPRFKTLAPLPVKLTATAEPETDKVAPAATLPVSLVVSVCALLTVPLRMSKEVADAPGAAKANDSEAITGTRDRRLAVGWAVVLGVTSVGRGNAIEVMVGWRSLVGIGGIGMQRSRAPPFFITFCFNDAEVSPSVVRSGRQHAETSELGLQHSGRRSRRSMLSKRAECSERPVKGSLR